ncbi:DMT family transporter [Rhodobium gokarnense]|uniref:Drug/metabolite transporter (DMT)-like permease n=1 Tax=Rhodobium gokarnense TaxID=364296 RepID=A0ABT3H6R8_9HYPH|nr:DMT family transporter [Rhodobium gokarnense]MCW2306084.1 drug/metabolite transporter (DMT)-like permease [Rhodobium gokarnense]
MEWKLRNAPAAGHPTLGILSITGAVFLLSLSDALVKLAGERMGLGQLVLIRSAFAAILIAGAVAATSSLRRMRPVRPGWVLLRSLCLTGMWLCYYAALPAMSFALAAACYYTAPMWMAVLSWLVLKEPLGLRRWSAVVIGLAGVLIAINPGLGTVSPVVVLPLAAAFLYALAGIITWSRCRGESPLAMAQALNLTLMAGGGLAILALALIDPGPGAGFVLAVWPPLGLEDWLLMAALGVLLAVITVSVALAYRLGPPDIIGVFDNTYLLFAAVWGALIFADIPSLREGLGMALIATGALLASRAPPGKDCGKEKAGALGGHRPRPNAGRG